MRRLAYLFWALAVTLPAILHLDTEMPVTSRLMYGAYFALMAIASNCFYIGESEEAMNESEEAMNESNK